ncbi:MAG: hypothetical protein ACRC4W_05275, partial [Treponemataceae bacterium]
AVDLIASFINTFQYNSGFFTENKLPRGMLLIDGNANQETVEMMEDYLSDIMSGNPSNQWRVPIIPAGSGGSGDNGASIKWVNLNGTNREMEFQSWYDSLISGIISLFGCSVDELGIQSAKSQSIINNDNPNKQIESAKSIILGNTLSFLQQYINQIIEIAFPGYEMEFVGYEIQDPKQLLDITKDELGSYKTLNEVREEKGLRKIDGEWADKCPANPQFVQMYQASSTEENQDFGMDDFDNEGSEGNESWDSIDAKINEGDNGDDNEGNDDLNKSLVYTV